MVAEAKIIVWLRSQPWWVRLIISVVFLTIALVAYIHMPKSSDGTGIVPRVHNLRRSNYVFNIAWPLIFAVLPWIVPKPSNDGDDFFRPVKETSEVCFAVYRDLLSGEEMGKRLTKLASAITSGFGPQQVDLLMTVLAGLKDDQERRFQYIVSSAAKPASLQIVFRRKSRDAIELEVTTDSALIDFVKPDQPPGGDRPKELILKG